MAHLKTSNVPIFLRYMWLLLSLKLWRIIGKVPHLSSGQSRCAKPCCSRPAPPALTSTHLNSGFDGSSSIEMTIDWWSFLNFSQEQNFVFVEDNNVLGQVVRGICEVVQAMSEMFCFQSGFLTTWHEILVVLMYMEYSGFKRVIWEKVVLVLWPTQKNCSKAVWS